MDNKPICKYSIVKIKLDKILNNGQYMLKINDAVNRTHQLVIHAYQFMRLWVLNKYTKKLDIPILTDDLIKMIFCVLTEDSCGPRPKGDNLILHTEFKKFYSDVYSKLGYSNKISGNNLSAILDYQRIEMVTNVENNIKMHFKDYVKCFVKGTFKDKHNGILEKLKGKEKVEMRKMLNSQIGKITNDLLKNTLSSDEEYHQWIKEQRKLIFPNDIIELEQIELNANPQMYLKGMIYMNIELEKIGKKMFQFLPLRTECIPKYISIDTKSIIELLIDSDKQQYLIDIDNTKEEIWKKYFKMDHEVFDRKNYQFDYMIKTDGYATSIQFVNNAFYDIKMDKKANMKLAKRTAKRLYDKTITDIEIKMSLNLIKKYFFEDYTSMDINEYINEYNNIHIEAFNVASKIIDEHKKKISAEKKKAQKIKRNAYTEEFKKKSKEEQKKIMDSKKNSEEFPYFDDLTGDELTEMKESHKLYVDPGKKSPLTIMDDEGKIFRYTNSQRIKETKRIKYQTLLHNHKRKKDILLEEKILANYNSKTCNYEKFKEFITVKNKTNAKLFGRYEHTKFRQYKWYAYINTKKSEDKMLNNIENFFGIKNGRRKKDNKKVSILYGDWSVSKQMRHFMSTPMIGLKRKVKERFTVYNLDEFRTSCLDYQTETKCNNLYVPDKKGVIRSLHSVLVFSMTNRREGCRNRDTNSVNGMKKIVDYWMLNGERPLKYTRAYKFENETKDINPINGNALIVSNNIQAQDRSRIKESELDVKGAITALPNIIIQKINSDNNIVRKIKKRL